MPVFLVMMSYPISEGPDHRDVLGVYSTLNKAIDRVMTIYLEMAAAGRLNALRDESYWVEEWRIDSGCSVSISVSGEGISSNKLTPSVAAWKPSVLFESFDWKVYDKIF
jgi:hypothetical protein